MNAFYRALSRITSSQQTTRRRGAAPSLVFLLQHPSSYSTAIQTIRNSHKNNKNNEHNDQLKNHNPTTTPAPVDTQPSSTDWPRPKTIPFEPKIANSISLIGYVNMPIQTQVPSSDAKFWAATAISQESIQNSSAPWILIIFEGDLAHIATSHLRIGDCVCIAGQLIVDSPPFPGLQDQARAQVMVHRINFVEGSFQMMKSLPQQPEEGCVKDDVYPNKSGKDLMEKPHKWWDTRLEKDNPKGAALERRSNGEQLWLDDSTPKWIHQKLEAMKLDQRTILRGRQAHTKKVNDSELNSFKDLLENPNKWWDYRSKKRTGLVKPKHPDFKHKESCQPVWLYRAPRWILSGLKKVKFDVETEKMKQAGRDKGDKPWKDLVENPDKWWDNRLDKKNMKSPDFKHKESGEALWLETSPKWVLPKLPTLENAKNVAGRKREA